MTGWGAVLGRLRQLQAAAQAPDCRQQGGYEGLLEEKGIGATSH